MSCCRREKLKDVNADQKWDYINLSDFKSTSCFTPFSYGILWISLIISISVYAVDTFTAINLLVFNRWSSQVQPKVPFKYSKWIFAICIIVSFVLVGFEWVRALRVMKRGGVAESYLDPLAVRVQCIRFGKTGRGWRRFLVFAQLTKSKKGADYVALFSYFSFKAWLRIILAEGPRVAVNALTLWAVLQADLLPEKKHAPTNGRSSFSQFWFNVSILWNANRKQGVILCGMVWTMVIWAISAINLALAGIMYLLFLWHWVPSSDGSLSAYCKRKIDSRVNSIVSKTMEKAREKEETKRQLAEAKALKKGERIGQIKREPTLPILLDSEDNASTLSRQTTGSTLPQYTSRPGTRNDNDLSALERQPTLPDFGIKSSSGSIANDLSRNGTQTTLASNASYSSSAGLLSQAEPMGQTRPPLSKSAQFPNGRSLTNSSFGSSRPPPAQGRGTPGPPGSIRSEGSRTPGPGFGGSEGRRTPGPSGPAFTEGGFRGRAPPYPPGPPSGRSSPAPPRDRNGPGPRSSSDSFPFPSSGPPSRSGTPMNQPVSRSRTPMGGPNPPPPASAGGYVAFNPNRQPTGPLPRPPQRNMTEPSANFFPLNPTPRADTAPPRQNYGHETYNDDIYDAYASSGSNDLEMQSTPFRGPPQSRPPLQRAATAGLGGGGPEVRRGFL